ncbi:Rb-like protein, partial [Reticulomyxa filosa]
NIVFNCVFLKKKPCKKKNKIKQHKKKKKHHTHIKKKQQSKRWMQAAKAETSESQAATTAPPKDDDSAKGDNADNNSNTDNNSNANVNNNSNENDNDNDNSINNDTDKETTSQTVGKTKEERYRAIAEKLDHSSIRSMEIRKFISPLVLDEKMYAAVQPYNDTFSTIMKDMVWLLKFSDGVPTRDEPQLRDIINFSFAQSKKHQQTIQQFQVPQIAKHYLGRAIEKAHSRIVFRCIRKLFIGFPLFLKKK